MLNGSKRDDTDLRGDVLQALMLDSLVPKTVDAKVRGGFVTVTGTAQWQYQRDEAEFLTASVPGVFGIENDITLTSTPDGRDIKSDISDAFRRSARLDAEELSVDTTSYGAVILPSGSSWAAHTKRWPPHGPRLASPRSTTASWSSTSSTEPGMGISNSAGDA